MEFQNRFYHIIVNYIICQPMPTDKYHLVSIVFVILCFTAYDIIIRTKQAVFDILQTAGGNFHLHKLCRKKAIKKRDKQIKFVYPADYRSLINVYTLINTRPR